MNKQNKEFNEFVSTALSYLENQLFYSWSTVEDYRKGWNQIRVFMALNEIKYYTPDVGIQVIKHKFKDRSVEELSIYERWFIKSIFMLSEFQETGHIKLLPRPRKKPIIFSGPIGEIISDFLDYKRVEERLSIIRIHCYQRNLFRFLNFCNEKSISSIIEIDLVVILRFLNELGYRKETPISIVISSLRGFMKYAFDEKLLATDYSKKIPKYKVVIQPKLPSTYAKEEIEKLISTVERSSPIGKRNYAIILMAARLGRVQEIIDLTALMLRLNKPPTIKIIGKGNKARLVPMLDAQTEHLKNYLEENRLHETFANMYPLFFNSRKEKLTRAGINHIVQKYVKMARKENGMVIPENISCHSLRHSKAMHLLQAGVNLVYIRDILGHVSIQTTEIYARADSKQKREALEKAYVNVNPNEEPIWTKDETLVTWLKKF